MLFFALWGLGFFTAACAHGYDIVDRIVAVVNEDVITLSELNKMYKPYLEKVKNRGYTLKKQRKILFKTREKILQDVIDKKLADQEIRRSFLDVSKAEIDDAIEHLKRSYGYSDEALLRGLKRRGSTLKDFRGEMRAQILREKLIAHQVMSKIVITAEEIRAYYEKNKDQYAGSKKYHLRNIIKKAPPGTDPEIKKAKLHEMEEIMEKLKSGQSFAVLAKKYSESAFAAEGGDLGLFSVDQLAPGIRAALEGKRPGDFTSIIDTDQGLQIFFVQDIVELKGKTLEEAFAEIQYKIYKKTVNKKFRLWIENLRQQSHIQVLR